MKLTVYGRATSSNVQAVMWGAAELGLTPDRLDYGYNFGGTDSPEFRAMSPHGLVPVLKDDATVIWESCAILRYLAAQYGDGGAFWPADPTARARVDMWAEWGKTTFARDLTAPIFWPRVRQSRIGRDEAAMLANIDRFEGHMAILNAQLSGDFVVGDALTLADIVIGHVLYRYYDMDIPRRSFPAVAAYYTRLTGRPAYRTHVMVDYSILKHAEA